tara:strand:+ start:530 stop:1000 length:471 start_codon:yes stop_codon:yes gene_type:complete
MTDTKDLKHKFWTAMVDSPFVFLQLDGHAEGAVPMTAQLDKHADSAIWFFTRKDHHLASGGAATATFEAKGHDIFARFTGVISTETSKERLDKQWSSVVQAWFPGGKDDPNLIMLRMDLGQAEIWNSDLGFIDNAKMLLGFDVREEAREEHAETAL